MELSFFWRRYCLLWGTLSLLLFLKEPGQKIANPPPPQHPTVFLRGHGTFSLHFVSSRNSPWPRRASSPLRLRIIWCKSQGLPGIFLHFFSLPLDLLALVVGEVIVRYERIVRIRHERVQGAHGFRFFLFFLVGSFTGGIAGCASARDRLRSLLALGRFPPDVQDLSPITRHASHNKTCVP